MVKGRKQKIKNFYHEIKNVEYIYVWEIVGHSLSSKSNIMDLRKVRCKIIFYQDPTEIRLEYKDDTRRLVIVSLTPENFNVPKYEKKLKNKRKKRMSMVRFYKDKDTALRLLGSVVEKDGIEKAKELFPNLNIEQLMETHPEIFF